MTGGRYVMVSEWMVNGNINEFVEAYPDTDRLGLVSFLFRVLSSLAVLADDSLTSVAERCG